MIKAAIAPKISTVEIVTAFGVSAPLNFIIPRFKSDIRLVSSSGIPIRRLNSNRFYTLTMSQLGTLISIPDWFQARPSKAICSIKLANLSAFNACSPPTDG